MNDLVCVDPPAKPQKISLREAAVALATWFAADLAAGVLILAAGYAVMAKSGRTNPKDVLELLPADFTFVVTTTTVTALVAISVIWRTAKRHHPKPFGAFLSAIPTRTLGYAVLGGLGLVGIMLGLETALKSGLAVTLPISVAERAMIPHSGVQLIGAIIALGVIVPFVEEVLFRGYVLGWLRSVAPTWIAIPLSAAVFAAVHGLYVTRGGLSGWIGTAEIFAIGLVLAAIAVRTQSLRACIALHATYNAALFVLSFMAPTLYL